MKLATLTASAVAVLLCGLVMGCSSGRPVRPDTGGVSGTDTGPRVDSGIVVMIDAPPVTPIDAGRDAPPIAPIDAGRDARSGSMCVASCTTDSQCATSCPANPRGANCCDTLAGVCYAAMVAVCPVTTTEDGGPMTSM